MSCHLVPLRAKKKTEPFDGTSFCARAAIGGGFRVE
jgi:hypothetical protein